jgi:serine protease Do
MRIRRNHQQNITPQKLQNQYKPTKLVSLRTSLMLTALLAVFFSGLSLLLGWYIFKGSVSNTTIEQSQQIISSEGEVFNKIASEVGKSVVSVIVSQESGNSSAGSGFVIDSDGLILTNKHVIPAGTSQIEVIDYTSTKHTAKLIGRDSANDIAFIKVESLGDNIPPAKLADSSTVKVGDKVLAIGNALGEFQNTVTSGIVSGIGRPIEIGDSSGQDYESLSNLIQTDAAINPGNSGGPLVNMAGEVIGINTAIVEDAQSLGFSIPINDAKALIAQAQTNGNLGERSYLGVRYINLTEEIAQQLNLSINQGALVYSARGNAVEPNSPADQAGLRQKDVITNVQGIPINRTSSLPSVLSKFKPGQNIEITVLRNNQEIKLNATLTSSPN